MAADWLSLLLPLLHLPQMMPKIAGARGLLFLLLMAGSLLGRCWLQLLLLQVQVLPAPLLHSLAAFLQG
jgi:hypothetical protein